FRHGDDEQRAGDGTADRCRVEVRDARRRNVKRTGLERRDAFGHEWRSAVDQARMLGPIEQSLARNLVIVWFVGLAKVRGVSVGDRPLLTHPVKSRAGVQSTGEGNADFLA